MQEKKRIAILGSTGSIGTQTLEVVEGYPELFDVRVLTAYGNVDLLARQIRYFEPEHAVVSNEARREELKKIVGETPTRILSGEEALSQVVSTSDLDLVVVALVGYSGLMPTISAIRYGIPIALANKETLVVAGDLIKNLASEHQVEIYPVDSEHSAIYQCLVGEDRNEIEKIYLTASGGPFRQWGARELEQVTPAQALKHPNWSMGSKITIDSATMMNKGLEAIEAHWLFDLEPRQIDVIIHPQSIVHSIVQFADGSMKAQMGLPDMRVPIAYALTAPDRLKTRFKRFSFDEISKLTFEKPDPEKFINLNLAYQAMHHGGNMPCILNAANEVAVEAFLKEQIGFMEIPRIVEQSMKKIRHIPEPALEDYIQTDDETRVYARSLITKKETRKWRY
jgi:1-deoxy-D-xylulose-5-phosphate reductoisomerase